MHRYHRNDRQREKVPDQENMHSEMNYIIQKYIQVNIYPFQTYRISLKLHAMKSE